MRGLPVPEPPAAQVALRAVVEAVLDGAGPPVSYHHEDRCQESEDGREAVFGWGTRIELPPAAGGPVRVWFDGLDGDIAVWQGDRRRRGADVVWHEWRDLTDLTGVLDDVVRVLRTVLGTARRR
ncbi:hypothetical protein ACI79D_07540 [Geodermatophilus sp. SYSU D00708]